MKKIWKTIIAVVLLAMMMITLTGCGGGDQTDGSSSETVEEFSYVFNDTEEFARLVRYNGEGTEVVIPDTLGGKPVQEIGQYAFLNAPQVTSITIPASVKKIEDPSFYSLSALSTIIVAEDNISYTVVDNVLYHKKMGTIYCYPQGKTGDSYVLPDSVKAIGEKAFYNCQLKEITMGEKLAKIYVAAFANSKNLTTVNFSQKISQIYENAFENCVSLKDLVFPDSLTSIGNYCFSGCTSLTEIKLPVNCGVLDNAAFMGCTSLKSVVIEGSGIQRIAEDTFNGDVALESFTASANLMGIADRAFKNCEKLAGITMTDKLVTIGEEAFFGCTALENIEFPSSVTQVGGKAFEGTAYLTSHPEEYVIVGNGILLSYKGSDTEITVPENVKIVSYLNDKVTKVTLPEGVVSLSDGAFKNCTALTAIQLPSTLTAIGNECFSGCTALTVFEIPSKLATIGDYCFKGCESLEKFTVDASNITFNEDQGILYDKIHKSLICFPMNSSVTAYTMAYGPTSIAEGAVQGVKNLESFDATAAEGITALKDYVFADCPKLKTVKLTSSFVTFGNYVFENCTALTSVDIQYTTTGIGEGCFKNCTALTETYLQSPVAKIGLNALDGVSNIKVDANSVAEEYCKSFNITYKK